MAEVAGLVLAAFPLVLQGLQAYGEGCRNAKALIRHKKHLDDFARDVRVEYFLFGDNCEVFLRDIVSESELCELRGNPSGGCWKLWEIEARLLRAGSYSPEIVDLLMELVFQMGAALESLKKKLSLNEENKAMCETGITRRGLAQRAIVSIKRQECTEEVQTMTKLNRQLGGLCKATTVISSSTPKIFKGAAQHYERIRAHATNLYQSLEDNLLTKPLCACITSHAASLQLEARWFSEKPKGSKVPEVKSHLRFRVALSNKKLAGEDAAVGWKTLEVEPVETGDETANHPAITLSNAFLVDQPRGGTQVNGISVGCRQVSVLPTRSGNNLSPRWNLRSRSNSCDGGGSPSDNGEDQLSDDGNSTTSLNRSPKSSREKLFSALIPSSRKKKCAKQARFVDDLHVHARSFHPTTTVPASVPAPSGTASTAGQAYTAAETAATTDERMCEITENLCTAICNAVKDRICLGIMISNANKQRLWCDQKAFRSISASKVVSLAEILPKLERRESIILAVKLASTVMQLHSTEWLQKSWSASDIVFPATDDGGISCILQQPLLRRSLQRRAIGEDRSLIQSFMTRDETLYSLGLVLVELYYGKRLEALIAANFPTASQCPQSEAAREQHIMHCVGLLGQDAPPDYACAVRRCIFQGSFDTALDKTGLHVDEFKNEVQSKIVFPLESYLKYYSGKSLAEVLG